MHVCVGVRVCLFIWIVAKSVGASAYVGVCRCWLIITMDQG